MRTRASQKITRAWMRLGPAALPFADAVSAELPLARLLRLSLFQVTVGMATVLLIGTLNRVLIVELGVSAWLVSLMVALPLVFAPFRTLVGFRSDHHRSVLGWRRVPYIWMGTLLQFGGLSIMPFALIVLSGDTHGPVIYGHIASALAFLLVGAGLQTTQTAGLALATDLSPPESRPSVIALMYVMLLLGMVISGLAFGALLAHFNQIRLIQVVQASAVATMALNVIALWKQEARDPARTRGDTPMPAFRDVWQGWISQPRSLRFLVAVAIGTAAFNMQDIILEPYGGQVLGLAVGQTTLLTSALAGGTLCAFVLAGRLLTHGSDPCRLAALGALIGVVAFALVIFAAPLEKAMLFRLGTPLIGFGAGLFAVGTLAEAMDRERLGNNGLALGAWGAAQATAAGLGIALGGALRDGMSAVAARGGLGEALARPAAGYGFVYLLEIILLFLTLAVLGPLVGARRVAMPHAGTEVGLAANAG